MKFSTYAVLAVAAFQGAAARLVTRNAINDGYQKKPEISHFWGQYSPWFKVPSNVSASIPKGCRVTFANSLSRHGARFPTASKSKTYNATIATLKSQVKSYSGDYAFLKNYTYKLGSDDLTKFGQVEMYDSGIKFYRRYKNLTERYTPFIRASSEDRVVVSARNFSAGYHHVKKSDNASYPYPILILSEAVGQNNTLNHGLCNNFENNTVYSGIADRAQKTFLASFAAPITARLNQNLPGANLSATDTISIMDLCPFETVANDKGNISPFCKLFTEEEWKGYGYYQSLGKYYGYGNGNPFGPTNGVGWTNELIARLTNTPVMDRTSVNQTLDSSNKTFPIGSGAVLFSDFTHDNDMTGIFAALGLYNTTTALSNTTIQTTTQTSGFSASWTVPFGARAYVEKLDCGSGENHVRVLVNDRVMPMPFCGSDSLGRCTLSKFVGSLTFAKSGGRWSQC